MKILVDFSQTVIASSMVQIRDSFSKDNPDSKNLTKHVVLNTLLALKKKFGGELIICCDSGKYWRKEDFAWYKGHRKHSRESSSFDWEFFFEILGEIKEELMENFPYKVLSIDGVEADDIIATLCKYFDENELVHTGLIEEPDEVVIVSTDGDMPQLQKYRHVKQWNNVTKKFVTTKNPKQYLVEHICSGDTGDNIPNVCTNESWSIARVEGKESVRQSPFKTARYEEFYKKGIDACKDENERINYIRNQKLIDFDFIPEKVQAKIVSEYVNYEIKGSKPRVMNYLLKHKMKVLLKSVTDF